MASPSIWRVKPLSTDLLTFATSRNSLSQPSIPMPGQLARRFRHFRAGPKAHESDFHWLLRQAQGRGSGHRGWQYHSSHRGSRRSYSGWSAWPPRAIATIALIPFSVIQLDDAAGHNYNNPQVAQKLRGSDVEDPNELHLPGHEEDLEDDAYRRANVFKKLWILLNRWIIEPIGTGRRFLYLAFLFLPVIATAPVLALEWLDKTEIPHAPRTGRSRRRQKERRTTNWWYRFLVKQMERAGPTFIKASLLSIAI